MIIVGISSRLAWDGNLYPYLIVVDDGQRLLQSTIRLPDSKYLNPPVHPEYGDLMTGPTLDEVLGAIEWHCKGKRVHSHKDNENSEILKNLDVIFHDCEIDTRYETAFQQIEAIRKTHANFEGLQD